MHRIVLQLPWFTLYSYGLLITVGFGVGILYFLNSTKKNHLPQHLMFNLATGIILFAVVGARAFYILTHLNYYILYPDKIYRLWEGGMVLYGGLFLSLIFSIYYIKVHNLSFYQIADCAAPGISFGLSIGRIGCFLNGCCYGIPSSFGFVFPSNSPAGKIFPHQTLFPAQLVSSFNLFLMGIILHLFKKRGTAKYKLLPLFLIFYSVHRFFIEFLRADTHPIAFNLTLFQVISIILIVFSLIWLKLQFKFS